MMEDYLREKWIGSDSSDSTSLRTPVSLVAASDRAKPLPINWNLELHLNAGKFRPKVEKANVPFQCNSHINALES